MAWPQPPCPAQKAPPARNFIDGRQVRREHRTGQGIASGNLTAQESARIERRNKKLHAAEDKFLSDGSMSKGEARRLNRAYDRQSTFICRRKHDGQARQACGHRLNGLPPRGSGHSP